MCPLCHGRFERVGRSLRCPQGHSFDLAREGYVNLLRSNHPGDTREMLACRRRFLDRGHYAPMGRRVCELVESHLAISPSPMDGRKRSVLDSGCGDGYYLGLIEECLEASGDTGIEYIGVDSSKDAARLAAQRHHGMYFCVADVKELLPVEAGSLDVVLDIFAPRNGAEFARVLAAHGKLIVVVPQPHHLRELRSSFALIGIESAKTERVVLGFKPHLDLVHVESVEYQLVLQGEEVVDLVGMSPSRRHLTAPIHPPSEPAPVTVAVDILSFRRSME